MKIDKAAIDSILRTSLANDALNLILMPTEACNFRCVYCYEDFKLGRMAPHVVRGVKNLLSARAPELQRLDLSWFGGEPLLALDVMGDILVHVGDLVRRHPGLYHESNITTNAWKLSRDVFERLLGLGVVSYQISFDGPRELHDKKRVRADGAPTFERVWNNVKALRDVDGHFKVVIRIHVDRENESAMPEFVDECRDTFGADSRFELFIRQLSCLGGPNDSRLPILRGEEGMDRIDELRRRAAGATEGAPTASASASVGAKIQSPAVPSVCYATRANSFVVRADGRIGKCTVALDHPANQVGVLHENGELEITAARMLDWMRGLRSRNPIELFCPMIGLADPAPPQAAAS
jgi:uncharacterized protein